MSGTDEYPGMLFPLGQADNALRLAGLKDDDLFRVELRQAIKAFAELIAADRELDLARANLAKSRWYDDQHDLKCVGRAIAAAWERRAAALAAVNGQQQDCTCPSGDGSLRWPCPRHPPEVDNG